MTDLPYLPGVRRLADRYDLFVVDLWGTLHDGVKAYPGAVRTLAKLRALAKPVALLSNAPKRLAQTARILDAVGIPSDLYTQLMTSGESVHRALRDRTDPWHSRLEGPCWHLGPSWDRGIFDGLDLEIVDGPRGAGFCVATGTRLNTERVEDYQEALDQGLALGLPMICANPDILVPAGDTLAICAGAFAQYYEQNGGDVYWHGKPYGNIYRRLFAALAASRNLSKEPARMLAVGDGLPTDIVGANSLGIDSAFIAGGLHRRQLNFDWRGRPDRGVLEALLASVGARPNYVLPRFVW